MPAFSAPKPRYEKPKLPKQPLFSLNPSSLDSFLTPPTSNDFDALAQYKRGPAAGAKRNRRPVRTNSRDQNIAGTDFLPEIHLSHDVITEKSSSIPSVKRKATTPINVSLPTNRIPPPPPPPPSTVSQLPSISTASTSSIDLGKRVNYNYHPIIDFFGDSLKSEKEIDDRVGYSEPLTWRPVQMTQMMRRRHQR